MKNLQHKSTVISISLLSLLVLTIIINQNKSDWHCGIMPVLIYIISLPIQAVLNVMIIKIKNQKTALYLAAVSLMILLTAVTLFIRFLFCTNA